MFASNSVHSRPPRAPVPGQNLKAWLVQLEFRPTCTRSNPGGYRAPRARICRGWKVAEAAYRHSLPQNSERAKTYAWSADLGYHLFCFEDPCFEDPAPAFRCQWVGRERDCFVISEFA